MADMARKKVWSLGVKKINKRKKKEVIVSVCI
jgi:hypothetical protein